MGSCGRACTAGMQQIPCSRVTLGALQYRSLDRIEYAITTRVTVVMASESLCSPQHPRSPLDSNQRSGEDGSDREIELLNSRVAELERKFDESRNEVRQVMAELEMLQRTIDQRNQQVEPLENEIQLQVG